MAALLPWARSSGHSICLATASSTRSCAISAAPRTSLSSTNRRRSKSSISLRERSSICLSSTLRRCSRSIVWVRAFGAPFTARAKMGPSRSSGSGFGCGSSAATLNSKARSTRSERSIGAREPALQAVVDEFCLQRGNAYEYRRRAAIDQSHEQGALIELIHAATPDLDALDLRARQHERATEAPGAFDFELTFADQDRSARGTAQPRQKRQSQEPKHDEHVVTPGFEQGEHHAAHE